MAQRVTRVEYKLKLKLKVKLKLKLKLKLKIIILAYREFIESNFIIDWV
jgi:hypothetical protein